MSSSAHDPADLRTEYKRAALGENDADADPVAQFRRWFGDALAAQVPEPTAMTLATVGDGGRPSARIVLLKGFDARGFVFYTNYASRKARELAGDAHAALLFHWVELERQVRIEGRVERVDAAESDAYFASRPRASRVGAWASPQSAPIDDRGWLERRFAEIEARFPDAVARPPHWGGYRVRADRFEFWQGRRSRLHDRLVYTPRGDGWSIGRLAP